VFDGRLGDQRVVFLPRHGRGHRIPPSALNFRANIDALKRLGVTDVVSISACGSLREDRPPGAFVIVDQFIDRTFAREKSFFGPGLVAHVSMAHPVCPRLGDALETAARELGLKHKRGGTYLAMEGPQFSTFAESNLYRSWGCSVIGMTAMPEAKLAREAEISYATIAMVTDFDCWHPDHEAVTVDQVVKVLFGNADKARALVADVVPGLGAPRGLCPAGCDRALDHALITAPEMRDPVLLAKLDADDVALPNRLAAQVRFLEEHPDHGVVGSKAWLIDPEGRRHGVPDRATSSEAIHAHLFRFKSNPIVTSSVVLRRDLFRAAGGERACFGNCHDLDLWLRLGRMTKLAALAEPFVEYRVHADQVSLTHVRQQAVECVAAFESAARRDGGLADPFSATSPRASSQRPIASAASVVTFACHSSGLTGSARPGRCRVWRRAGSGWRAGRAPILPGPWGSPPATTRPNGWA
jgi:5'-methylthioadenosine phosphorylase